jgi:anti-sigma B factor antagonist
MAGFHVQPAPDGVLYLAGELEMATAEGFPADAAANLDGHRELILDVSELEFIDSTGIRALLELSRLAAPRGVVLRHPRPNVDAVLGIVNIDSLGIRVER